MKKAVSLLLVVFFILNSVLGVFASQEVRVTVDGEVVAFPDAKPFIDSNGRTLIPLRFVAEKLGATVDWNESTREIKITRGDKELELKIDSNYMRTKDGYKAMDTKAIIRGGRTFVPIKFIAEGLGASVDWDGKSKTVIIKSQDIDTIEGGDEKYMSRYTNLNPLIGVPKDKEFILKFNSNLFEGPLTVYGYVRVFSDAACKNEVLSVDIETDYESRTVTLKPPKVSNAPRMLKSEAGASGRSWGGYNKYYLVIDRDMESTQYKILNKPLRMMFTVASEAEIPTLNFKVTEDGLVKLYWDKVEGATEYRIYKASSAYDSSQLELLAKTKSTEYSDFSTEEYMDFSANSEFRGAYYVTSVVNGKESRISNLIDSDAFENQVPANTEYGDISSVADTLLDLPKTAKVHMTDYYTVKNYKIKWDYANLKMDKAVLFGSSPESGTIAYSIPGTVFKGTVWVKKVDQALLNELGGKAENEITNTGVIKPKDNIKDNPPPEIKTDTGSTPVDIKEQLPKETPKNSLRETIETALLKNQEQVSLSKFPEAADTVYLQDLMLEIKYQNPYILNEQDYDYDYRTKTLILKYEERDLSIVSKKQEEMKAKVKQVVSDLIKPGMSDFEKEKVLHDYLVDNGTYDFKALEAGKQNNYQSAPEEFNDSFTAYGILVKGVGVCISYAEAYKLLCEEAGLECIVVTGDMNNIGHAWNKVKLGNMYYHVDVTNNDTDGAPPPYPIYNASDKTVSADFTEDKDYALDEELKKYECTDDSQDYYTKQGLTASSKQELKEKINQALKSGSKFYVKITNSDISRSDILEVLQEIEDSNNLTTINPSMFVSILYGEAVP